MDTGAKHVPRASLDLTHVLYDDSSLVSTALALVTLSPILLMASYAALAAYTREFTIIMMWGGQFACEGLNWILKHLIQQERPAESVGNGYGFPSSHSQYMGYFATFLILHLHNRHRPSSFGFPALDVLARVSLYGAIIGWAGAVCYSRYDLTYHSVPQIFWGLSIGVLCGGVFYTFCETIPIRHPDSLLGRFRTFLLTNPISTFLRIRDSWMVWPDGGLEEGWRVWNVRVRAQDDRKDQPKEKANRTE